MYGAVVAYMKRDVKYLVYDSPLDENFAERVDGYLKRSKWNEYYNLINVKYRDDPETTADMYIRLVPDNEIYQQSNDLYPDGTPIRFSTTVQSGIMKPQISINSVNWLNGVKQSGLSLDEYREYVINHEVGHGLGKDHLTCDGKTVVDGRCPVMYQSTRGCPDGFLCGYQPSVNDSNANNIPGAWIIVN